MNSKKNRDKINKRDNSENIIKIMESLSNEYLQALPNKWAAINGALTALDKVKLQTEFHNIKGTGRTYGFPEVSLLGAAMEEICKLDPTDLDFWVKRSLELLKKTIEHRKNNSEFLIDSESDYQKLIQFIRDNKK